METGYAYYQDSLKSAFSRKQVLDKYGTYSYEICKHLVKVLTIKSDAESHWVKEINNWMRDLKDLKCKCSLDDNTLFNSINHIRDINIPLVVLQYCDDSKNTGERADVYEKYKKAIGCVKSILDEFVKYKGRALDFDIRNLTSFKKALSSRGISTFIVTTESIRLKGLVP